MITAMPLALLRGRPGRRSAATALVFALAVAMVSVPSPADAANFIGCKWPSFAITYKNSFSGAYLTQGNQATGNWSSATQVELFQVTSNPTSPRSTATTVQLETLALQGTPVLAGSSSRVC